MQKIRTFLKWKRYKNWTLPSKLTLWAFILAIICFVIALNECGHRKSNEADNFTRQLENARKGVLKINELTTTDLNYLYTVCLGSNTLRVSKGSLIEGMDLDNCIMCDNAFPITMKLKNGKVFISCKFYNLNNEIVGEIENNEWQLNSNFYKRNYDNNAIEVIDNYDIVIMQVILEGEKIKINGVLHCGNQLLICNGSGVIGHPLDPTSETEKSLYLSEARKIKRIFEYTGDNWLGKRKSTTSN
jgi:hypothetical protein